MGPCVKKGWWAKLTATKLKHGLKYEPCEEGSCTLGQFARSFNAAQTTQARKTRLTARAAFTEAYKARDNLLQCSQCAGNVTGKPTGWVDRGEQGWELFKKLGDPDYVNARMKGSDIETDFS